MKQIKSTIKKYSYMCYYCNKSFNNTAERSFHIANGHFKIKPLKMTYTCYYCDKPYDTYDGRDLHIWNDHIKFSKRCPYCFRIINKCVCSNLLC